MIIKLENVTKVYQSGDGRIKAVFEANLEVEKGQFLSILGHSGSGKTTLLNLVGGLTKPTSGRVLIDDKDIWSLSDQAQSLLRHQKIGLIFQFASLVPTLSTLDNVRLPTAFGPTENAQSARELLELVGIGEKIKSLPSQLSGGQQRRVAIARALLNNPEIILADEPTGDLDEETEVEIMRLFKKLNTDGMTILMVTHNQLLAKQANRVLQMSHGVLSEPGKTG